MRFAWALAVLAAAAPARAVDFNRDVRPLLSEHCFHCHGPDAKDRKARLRLDEEKGSRAVVVPGKPAESEFFKRLVATDESERMPPPKTGKKLSPAEIETLRQWIAEGANYEAPWAYSAPKRHPAPAVVDAKWPLGDIDRFVLARLEREKLRPSPDADKLTLVRRLTFDLLGLPPTFEEADAYVRDAAPDATERLVDRLLASEHFGERMAMYWLDLVRYADTVGYHGDQDHHASPYRDYVIDAFNRNLPFDQFTREQLAGDLLPNPTIDQRVATAYNRILQTSHEGGVQPKEYLAIYAADRVRNVSAVWMGATVGCAQCHNHKYDPYSMRDFYSLAAFFADVDEEKHLRGGGADAIPTKRFPEIPVHSRREREQIAALEAKLAGLADPSAAAALQKELAALKKATRPVMVTVATTPRVTRVLPRGNWLDDSGEIVSPAVPEFQGKLPIKARATRLDLANWLVDAKAGVGGLTARVFVNRVWYLLFGAGLSRSLEDFGGQGEPPSHPELLDRLAIDFASDWDVKKLVRQIVTSRTYRQASLEPAALRERDPDNRLLARQARYRLPAETVRDVALATSGLLVADVGGRSGKPYQPAGYYRHLNFPKREYAPSKDSNQWRRGVYVHWQRQYLHPMLKAFDAPTREECTAQRPKSNTPLAALVLLNDPSFLEAARGLAQRTLQAGAATDADRVTFAFRQVVQRTPDVFERDVLLKQLAEGRKAYRSSAAAAKELLAGSGLAPRPAGLDDAELAAWTGTCRVLYNLSETYWRE